MRVRVKERGFVMDRRLEGYTNIDDILVREDILEPENASVSVFFRGSGNSGIIDLTKEEAEKLIKTVSKQLSSLKRIKKV